MKLSTLIRNAVNRTLVENNFNQSLAAKLLDVSRGTVRKYMDASLKTRFIREEDRLRSEYKKLKLEEFNTEV